MVVFCVDNRRVKGREEGRGKREEANLKKNHFPFSTNNSHRLGYK